MPWYRTGTVSVTNNSTTVTGTGTDFSANSRVGDAFQGPDGRWYEVTNIASTTVISILPAYQGTTASGGVYGLAPMQGYVKQSADQLRAITNQYGTTLGILGTPSNATQLRTNILAAKSGANSDITSITGLTTALSIAQGGTGGTSQATARTGLGLGDIATASASDYVAVSSTQTISGLKTFTGASIRAQSAAPGLWVDEVGGALSCYIVLAGQQLQFQKRASGFGGVAGTGPISIDLTNNEVRFGNLIRPLVDNSLTCGSAAQRWSTLYAGTGTINTSDAREKTPVRPLSVNEIEAAKQISKEIGAYKWLTQVAEKGDSARDHVGTTVQRAIEIMEHHGLNPFAYGFICYDSWDKKEVEVPAEYEDYVDDLGVEQKRLVIPSKLVVEQEAGDRYSFRMDELNMFIAAGFEARLSALESA